MNGAPFQLAPPPSDQQEYDFLAAWKAGIKASQHPSFFGGDAQHLDRIHLKEPLAPRTKTINPKILELPISQAALVAAMVGFYNPADGHRLQAKLNIKTTAELAQALNPAQREIVAQLLINYERW